MSNQPHFVDMKGKKVGWLRVLKRGKDRRRRNGKNCVVWICRCRCSKVFGALGIHLRSGRTTSCGCKRELMLPRSRITHGRSRTTEYRSWAMMRQRCGNRKNGSFKDYGGRGIKVCKRWIKFENFLRDMGLKPGPGYSIDRKNSNRGYRPSNCRWATKGTQSLNKRNVRILRLGKTKLTAREWAKVLGICHRTILNRINKMGWSIKKALTTKARSRHTRKTASIP